MQLAQEDVMENAMLDAQRRVKIPVSEIVLQHVLIHVKVKVLYI